MVHDIKKPHPTDSKKTEMPAQQAFDKAATAERITMNPLKIKKGNIGISQRGLAVFLGRKGIACLTAVHKGITHGYAIAKTFEISQPTAHRTLVDLFEGGLLKKSVVIKNGRGVVQHELTDDGRMLVGIMTRSNDPVFSECLDWIENNR